MWTDWVNGKPPTMQAQGLGRSQLRKGIKSGFFHDWHFSQFPISDGRKKLVEYQYNQERQSPLTGVSLHRTPSQTAGQTTC